jgi:hypothetical protein
VEIFHRGKLVATHLRSHRQHRPTTLAGFCQGSGLWRGILAGLGGCW